LSIIPVRAENREQSEMVTQLLFGDIFTVVSEKKNWLEIQIDADGYEGWIDKTMFFEISKAQFEQIKHTKAPINNNLICYLESEEETRHLVKGSSFPMLENQQIIIGDKSYSVKDFMAVEGEDIRKEIIETAKKTQGLKAEDIAEAILFALQSPEHMNVNEILVRPTSQER